MKIIFLFDVASTSLHGTVKDASTIVDPSIDGIDETAKDAKSIKIKSYEIDIANEGGYSVTKTISKEEYETGVYNTPRTKKIKINYW